LLAEKGKALAIRGLIIDKLRNMDARPSYEQILTGKRLYELGTK
jgi:hypothetical protein